MYDHTPQIDCIILLLQTNSRQSLKHGCVHVNGLELMT